MRRLGLIAVTSIALVFGSAISAVAEPEATPIAPVVGDLLGAIQEPVTSSDKAEAADALDAVKELFAPDESGQGDQSGQGGDAQPTPGTAAPADATLAVRDLALRARALGRNATYAYNQRPWNDGALGSQRQCTTKTATSPGNICVHWATTSATTGKGADISNSTWATGTVLRELDTISATYKAAGYRLPVGDSATVTNPYSRYYRSATTWGGSAQTDVYLMDLGGTSLYGYCAYDLNDDGSLTYYPVRGKDAIPAFCVLDNDFSGQQYRSTFAGETPTHRLQATAAHEYFHAVQFGYDVLEDGWFMEATATWAERQVYPAVPDNRQYYPSSQIRYPGVSLDTWNGARGSLQYADWIYFQYLSRLAPAKTGRLPLIVRRMWEYADSLNGPDQYSIQAVASAQSAARLDFTTTFAQYATANRRASRTYLSDATLPAAAPRKTYSVRSRGSVRSTVRIDHLASATYRFVPRKVRPVSRKARISVNMAKRSYGSAAIVTVVRRNGSATTHRIRLNKKGDGSVRIPFSTGRVAYVELTLVNASRSYRGCSNNSAGYSCGGAPVHDRVKEAWAFRA